jgi:choline dehydrogenase-like flavoprotein
VSRVAIVGSGVVGSNLALDLARLGHEVTVFEKGPDYPYPHEEPFLEVARYHDDDPRRNAPRDQRLVTMTGQYTRDLTDEAVMRVGGAGTVWTGLTMRMREVDFRTKSAFGFGDDWPLTYGEVEPWYCAAEERMGVSGTDDDNPWAPPRSKPYPMPPFELTWDDRLLGERLAKAGIHLHTTPQARTRHEYAGRAACQNFNACTQCPVGARYSPTVHLLEAVATGRCTVRHGVAVRRVVTDGAGRARALVCRPLDGGAEFEFGADLVVIAAGAFESARLLLLSTDATHPDGLGNASGQVGRNLVFHHIWAGHLHFREKFWAGRLGPWTGQTEQFCDPEGRGPFGGLKVEFPSSPSPSHMDEAAGAATVEEALARMEPMRRCRRLAMHAESVPDDRKFVRLSSARDRFGDPRLDIHYDLNDFDRRTFDFSRDVFRRFATATGAQDWEYRAIEDFGIFNHYSGTCRMAAGPGQGVVNAWGEVFGTPGLWVLGLSTFVNAGGALNPTLTGLALGMRSAGRMHERLAAG